MRQIPVTASWKTLLLLFLNHSLEISPSKQVCKFHSLARRQRSSTHKPGATLPIIPPGTSQLCCRQYSGIKFVWSWLSFFWKTGTVANNGTRPDDIGAVCSKRWESFRRFVRRRMQRICVATCVRGM